MKAFSFFHPQRPLDAGDVLFETPLDFAALVAGAELMHAGQVTLRVAAIPDLITMKEHSGRAQDLADIDALRRILEATHRG